MKKRIVSMILAICMLVVMIPAAFAAQVSTPTGLEWCKTSGTIESIDSEHPDQVSTTYISPWDMIWNRVPDGSNEYDIKLYKDGSLVDKSTWTFSATDISNQLSIDLFRTLPRESGTYTFTIQALGNGQDLTDSEIATSEPMQYNAPSAQLGLATNLRWDGSTARWDAVPSADAYEINWYYSETANGSFEPAGSTWGFANNYIKLEDWVVIENGEGYYSFEIRALTDDVNTFLPGELSARSSVYSTADETADISTSLDTILNGLNDSSSEDDIQNAISQVKDLDGEALRIAMESDKNNENVNQQIKDLESKSKIKFETSVSQGIALDAEKVSMTGAILNADAGAQKVTFNISKPATGIVVPGAYANAVQFDFKLDGASVESSGEFAVPIKITMPIPDNIVPDKLRILHYNADNTVNEIILPSIHQDAAGNWYASFVVTHFSIFVFANTTTAAAIGENYYDTLQSAINSAKSGDTISLYRDHDDTEVRVAGKSLDISCGVYTLRPDVVTVAADCTKTVTGTNGTDQVIHIVYSPSSSGSSSSSSNRPNASVNGTGGTVSASINGTVTITPDKGYQIAGVTVNGKAVAIPANGKLTGLHQGDKVVVTFEKITDTGSSTHTPFTDVADAAWYADAVRYVYEKGMMNGTGSNTFSPNETTTRGMIVTMLHRLEKEPSAASADFSDVSANAYYADAVSWAAANGIVNGVSGSMFAPDAAITREQMAAILYRYAQFKGYNVTASNSLTNYADASQISAYAVNAMRWANAEGLITGDTATTIKPASSATRAEVATILMRFCEKFS